MHYSGKGGKGESLVSAVGLIGIFFLFNENKITSWHDLWVVIGLLGVVTAFYFALRFVTVITRYMMMGEHYAKKHAHYSGCGGNCGCGSDCNCGSSSDCGCGNGECMCGDKCDCGPSCSCGQNCNCR